MRIGEIAVVGPPGKAKTEFIKSICQTSSEKDENTSFGKLQVNDQLMLHLYGISVDRNTRTFAWDMISKKILGYVVLFNWFDEKAVTEISPIIDFFSKRYETSLILAAYVDNGDYPLPKPFIEDGIPLAPESRLVFCKLNDKQTNNMVLVTLINMIISRLP